MVTLFILTALTGLTLTVYAEPIHQQERATPEPYNPQILVHPLQFYFRRVGIPLAKAIYKAEQAMKTDEGELNERIIGGVINPVGTSPFLGGIDITLTTGEHAMCGSSLLSNRRSLTAAHCWKDGQDQAEKFLLIHGSPTFYYGGVRTETKNVTVHEDYDTITFKNDIAMIVHPNIAFTDVIKKIELPFGDLLNNTFVNVTAQTVGYGRNDTFLPFIREQPQRLVSVQVMENKDCGAVYGENAIDNTRICTRDGPPGAEVGTCQGDSGGPLYTDINNVTYVIGITSFGDWLCEINPSVYTRVTWYIDWIQARMDDQGIEELLD